MLARAAFYHIVQLVIHSLVIHSIDGAAAPDWLARVSCLIFLRRLDDGLPFLRSLDPNERLGIPVVVGDVAQQGSLPLAFRGVNALRQPLLAEDAEETFH